MNKTVACSGIYSSFSIHRSALRIVSGLIALAVACMPAHAQKYCMLLGWLMWILSAVAVQPAFAQREAPAQKDYPTRVIRIVVPYGPGADPDVVGRTIAEKRAASLGHNIVHDNRGGGGGVLGTALVAKAAPDGYMLLLNVAAYAALPFMGAGRLRVLGITADKRWKKIPDVPTLAEAGVKDYKYDGWYGLWFPAGTLGAYVNRIQSEVVKALEDPLVKQRLDDQGLEGVGSTPQAFAKVIEDEFALNKKLTASMGIVPQ
ncbi:MAG: tripartite tricarboxylate transporter substrate-binding protein [Burkholderiales bacterium]